MSAVNQEIISNRKQLRKKLLLELYLFHFDNVGKAKLLSSEDIADTEIRLGYEYLNEKGLVGIKRVGNGAFNVSITAHGIDVVEK